MMESYLSTDQIRRLALDGMATDIGAKPTDPSPHAFVEEIMFSTTIVRSCRNRSEPRALHGLCACGVDSVPMVCRLVHHQMMVLHGPGGRLVRIYLGRQSTNGTIGLDPWRGKCLKNHLPLIVCRRAAHSHSMVRSWLPKAVSTTANATAGRTNSRQGPGRVNRGRQSPSQLYQLRQLVLRPTS